MDESNIFCSSMHKSVNIIIFVTISAFKMLYKLVLFICMMYAYLSGYTASALYYIR